MKKATTDGGINCRNKTDLRADKLVIKAAITMQKPFYKSINRY